MPTLTHLDPILRAQISGLDALTTLQKAVGEIFRHELLGQDQVLNTWMEAVGGRTLASHPRSFWRGLTLFGGCQGTKAEGKDLPRTRAADTRVGALGCGQMRVRGLASCAAPRKRWCIPKHLRSTQSSGFSIQLLF